MSATKPGTAAGSRDAAGSPGSTSSLRTANQRRVLDVVQRSGTTTQSEIARETGLAAGTVSSIVRELAAAEVLSTVAGAGRRGTTVRLSRGAGVVGSVDFGHSHVGVALGDMRGGVLGERSRQLPPAYSVDEGLGRASELLEALLTESGVRRSDLRNLGVGLPCPISDGIVMSSAIMPAWVGVNAREIVQTRLGAPVVVDNDANLGALGEHRLGVGRGHANVVFVKVSSGVGAGLILDHRIFRGAHGTAGEIGHLTFDEQGPLCRCGSRGCLEAYAATGSALAMMAGQMRRPGPDGSPAPEPVIDDVIRAAHRGDVSARRVFEDAGLHLGWGLATITNLLNPGVIAVGGDMSHAGEMLLESVRVGLRRHVLAGAASTPIKVAQLGDRASMLGGLLLAVDATDLVPDAG
ncbi:ROK family transcriptional regulator [Nocardioides korecus]